MEDILSFEYFSSRVTELSRSTKTKKDAYKQAEKQFQEKYGTRRYASYNCFKSLESRYHKKRRQSVINNK